MNSHVAITSTPEGEVTVHVCAWCLPKTNVLILFPCLRGIPISHGLCPTHFHAIMNDLDMPSFEKE